jgi:hypothetical protein
MPPSISIVSASIIAKIGHRCWTSKGEANTMRIVFFYERLITDRWFSQMSIIGDSFMTYGRSMTVISEWRAATSDAYRGRRLQRRFFYLMCILNLILRRAEIRVCFGIFWLRSRSCLMKFSNRVSFVANFTKKSSQTKLETKTRWNKTEMKRGTRITL